MVLMSYCNPYTKLGLLSNPFPRIPVPMEKNSVLIDVGRKFSLLRKLFLQTMTSGNSIVTSLIGPYGSGKTHYLKALFKAAKENRRSLTIYVDSPGADFFTIYKRALREIGLTVLNTMKSKIVEYALKIMRTNFELGYSWLLGEKLTYKERMKLNIRTNLSQEDAVDTLAEIIKTLFDKYGKITVILIDELETILDLTVRRKQKYLNNLRKFIDKTHRGLFMVLACTPAGWDTIVSSNPALVRRVSRIIYLENATFEEMRHIINGYLHKYMIDNSREIINDDVLRQVLEITDGNVGETLRLLSIIIDEAASNGISEINVEFVKKVLSENL